MKNMRQLRAERYLYTFGAKNTKIYLANGVNLCDNYARMEVRDHFQVKIKLLLIRRDTLALAEQCI